MVKDVQERRPDEAESEHRGHDVFVSYSRADRDAVVRLTEGLASKGKRAWVDLEDIPPSAEWMAEIRQAIEGADGYLVAISPDVARSKVCSEELEHARSAGKRIVPVLVRPTDPDSVPQSLASLNWIDATDGSLEGAVDRIVQALETDLEHTKAHTRLLVRASEWDSRSQPRSLLLRGEDVKDAETLLVAGQGKEPVPTPLQARYVQASRHGVSRRQRVAVAIAVCVALVAATLGAFAWQQRSEARNAQARAEAQQHEAEVQARVANSRALAAAALSRFDSQTDLGVLLALEAARTADTSEARDAIQVAVQRSLGIDRVLREHDGSANSVDYLPDGRLASTSDDDSMLISDLATGVVTDARTDVGEDPLRVSVSPDGRWVVTGDKHGRVIIWDTSDPTAAPVDVKANNGWTYDVRFGPDGTFASAGSDGTIRIWDPETARPVGPSIHGQRWSSVAFSPDGRLLASVGNDGVFEIRALDRPGVVIRSIKCGKTFLQGIAFSSDGETLAAGGPDGTVWMATLSARPACTPLLGHTDTIFHVAFSPDGSELASASADGTARLWDVDTGTQVGPPLAGHTDAVFDVAFSPDGDQLASSGHDGVIILWDLTQRPVSTTSPLTSLAFVPSRSAIVVGSLDGRILRIDASDPSKIEIVGSASAPVRAIAVSPDGDLVAAGYGDGDVRVWDVDDGRRVATLHPKGGSVNAVALSDDGRSLATGDQDGTIVLFDFATGRIRGEPLLGHEDAVYSLDFSPDGRLLASGSDDSTVRLWDVESGKAAGGPLEGHADIVYDVTFSPDGRLLASGSKDGSVVLWDVDTQTPFGEPMIQRGGVFDLAFDPTGGVLVSASYLRTLNFWDVASQRQIGEPVPGHTDWINGVAFSPDGGGLASVGQDGAITLWPSSAWKADPETVQASLCAVAGRDLTSEEWSQFVPFRTYASTCSASG